MKSYIRVFGKWTVYGWKAEAIGAAVVSLALYGVMSFALDVFA